MTLHAAPCNNRVSLQIYTTERLTLLMEANVLHSKQRVSLCTDNGVRGRNIPFVWVGCFYKTPEQPLTNMACVISSQGHCKAPRQLNGLIMGATVGAGRMCGCRTAWTHCFSGSVRLLPLQGKPQPVPRHRAPLIKSGMQGGRASI